MGKCFDDVLIKRSLRKCRLIGHLELGEKLPNRSYTGILGMFQSKQVDMYLRGESIYLHEEWLGKSPPIIMEEASVSQHIHEHRGAISIFDLLDNFKVDLTLAATYLLSFFAILSIAVLINEFSCRIRLEKKERIASAVSSFGVNSRLSAIGLFFVSIHLFIWFSQLFLTNNIKTNKVVIDTSRLIKSSSDLLSSPLVACFIKNDQMTNMITSSPTRNILTRVYYEKTRLRPEMNEERELLKSDLCLIERDPKMSKLIQSKIYLFSERKFVDFLLSIPFVAEGLPKKVWLNTKDMRGGPLYTYPLVMYYNPDKGARIGKEMLQNTENGLLPRIFDCSQNVGQANCRAQQVTVFETLESYIENYVEFSDLILENFRFIFIYYFLFSSLILVVFGTNHLIKFARKRAVLTRRWFEALFRSLAQGWLRRVVLTLRLRC